MTGHSFVCTLSYIDKRLNTDLLPYLMRIKKHFLFHFFLGLILFKWIRLENMLGWESLVSHTFQIIISNCLFLQLCHLLLTDLKKINTWYFTGRPILKKTIKTSQLLIFKSSNLNVQLIQTHTFNAIFTHMFTPLIKITSMTH